MSKVVDCVLGLKAYHECKMSSSGNGFYKHVKTPTFQLSSSATKVLPVSASKTSRHLDRNDSADGESDKLKGMIHAQRLLNVLILSTLLHGFGCLQ